MYHAVEETTTSTPFVMTDRSSGVVFLNAYYFTREYTAQNNHHLCDLIYIMDSISTHVAMKFGRYGK